MTVDIKKVKNVKKAEKLFRELSIDGQNEITIWLDNNCGTFKFSELSSVDLHHVTNLIESDLKAIKRNKKVLEQFKKVAE